MDGRKDKGSLVFEEYEEEGTKHLRKTTRTVEHLTFTVESGNRISIYCMLKSTKILKLAVVAAV
jgi:hypothetical protein